MTPNTIMDLIHNYQMAIENGESEFYIEGGKVIIKVVERREKNDRRISENNVEW